jgi:uncharacterized protein (TIGR01777 family)
MLVAISGASGLIGTALSAELTAAGDEVVRLVRTQARSASEIRWDPVSGLDPAVLTGVDAVVHLSGAPIAAGRWTPSRKAELRSSRIISTQTLVTAMASATPPPGVLICGSAIGYYGDTGDKMVDESGPAGVGFLPDLVRDWEAAAEPAAAAGIRVVNIRIGVVLAADGGMLGRLLLPFRLGVGAKIGSGRQYLSWISLTDTVRAIKFALDREDIAGPVNLTAPEPVTNAEFTKALAQALHRPAVLALPSPVLRAALGELASELLAGARVMPGKLLQAGFSFHDPDIRTALTAIAAARSVGP